MDTNQKAHGLDTDQVCIARSASFLYAIACDVEQNIQRGALTRALEIIIEAQLKRMQTRSCLRKREGVEIDRMLLRELEKASSHGSHTIERRGIRA